MKRISCPDLSPEQQSLLEGVRVRPIQPHEAERFDQVIATEHYLKNSCLVGRHLRHVAEWGGQWVGLLTWTPGAFNLKLREQWIGWSVEQKKRRLGLVVNNSRFLILPSFHVPNLASRVMKLSLQRLSQDWRQRYGHEVLVAETFVDPQQFLGTSYKASGWTLLGQTQGFARKRADFYLPHAHPKQLWVREIRPGARTVLRGRNQPQTLLEPQASQVRECPCSPEELQSMTQLFAGLPDWRQGDCDYPLASLVTVALCAMLCGVVLGQRDLAAFARNMTRQQKSLLRFPFLGRGRYRSPSETTFFKLLSQLDSRALEGALQRWLDHRLGPRRPRDDRVALDGKEQLNSQGFQSVSAYSVRDDRWLGSEPVAEGSNEIPAAQELLRRLQVEGAIVTADALHTQTETARIVVQERGGDYLFTVKGNQKGVQQSVRQLYAGLERAFSPSASPTGGPDL